MIKKIYKPFFFTGLGLISLIFFLQIFNLYVLRGSKAATENVDVTYTPVIIETSAGGILTPDKVHFNVLLSAGNGKKISGIDLTFKYDDGTDLLDYLSYSQSPPPLGYFDDQLVVETGIKDNAKTIRVALVAKKAETSLASSVTTLNFIFGVKKQTGTTTFGLIKESSQIVGPTKGNYFNINEPNGPLAIGVGVSPPPVSITPPTTTAAPGGGGASLNLKLKFQGITAQPADNLNTMKAMVKVVGNGVEATASGVIFKSDANAVWSSQTPITFSTTVPPGNGYTIFVKGEKHVQKKICDSTPTETSPATYRCTNGKITLVDGVNNLDFSGILLLGGDLPAQDGIVNSYDISLVRNNLGKSDAEAVSLADINKDGRVNTQDHSLIIFALSMRFDEE